MDSEFWDDLGRKVTGAVDVVGRKTEEVVEVTKLKGQQYAVERELATAYENAGKMLYDQYQANCVADENLACACEIVQEKEEKLKAILHKIEESKK